MNKRVRSKITGLAWWQNYYRSIRHCFMCGGTLREKYVPAEHRKRLVCSQCQQINYVNPKVVAGVIPVLPDGRIVLLQREIEPAKGAWSYPAGHQEVGETVEAAAVRETWEEICIRIKLQGLVGIYSYPNAGIVTIVYWGRVPKGQKPAPGIESQSVAVFSPKDIPWKTLAFRSTKHALRDWLRCAK